jgi:hypothetical protein
LAAPVISFPVICAPAIQSPACGVDSSWLDSSHAPDPDWSFAGRREWLDDANACRQSTRRPLRAIHETARR